MKSMIFTFLILASFLIHTPGFAKILTLRPHGGLGVSRSSTTRYSGTTVYGGMRFLLDAGNQKSYGIEASYYTLKEGDSFTLLGFVLENKLWKWFHMSIGSVGYFNFLDTSDHPVGLTTNLGWEPTGRGLTPSVTLRNDFIFHHRTVIVQSICFALRW